MAEKMGRKISMLFDGVCMLFGITLIGFSKSYWVILTGRFICGISGCASQSVIPAYVSEISQPRFRNVSGLMYTMFWNLGQFIMVLLGAMVTWNMAVWIVMIFPLLHVSGVLAICPESPVWLLTNGKTEEGRKVLEFLRSDFDLVKAEEQRILNSVYQAQKNNKQRSSMFYLSVFKQKTFLKPFLTICLVLCIFYEWGGIPCISFYMNQILMDVKVPMDEYSATAVINGFRIVSMLVADTVIYKFKMRTVFFSTAICYLILLACLALYCYLNNGGAITKLYPGAAWTPIICILLMFSTSAFGCYNFIWNFTGMLLPSHARTFGAGMVGVLDHFSIALLSILLPIMMERIGWHGIFCTCFTCCAVSVGILWITLPETNDKTLEEIELEYRTNGVSEETPLVPRIENEETK